MAKFETYKADGKLQLSSEFMQYYIRATGSVVLNDASFYGANYGTGQDTAAGPALYTYTVGSTGAPELGDGEMIAFRCSEPIVYTAYPSGNVGGIYPATRSTNSPTLYWYTFAPYLNRTPSNFGLVLYDSNGKVTFDAAARPMLAVGNYPITSVSTTEQSITMLSGRTYAAFFTKTSVLQESTFQGYTSPTQSAMPFNGAEVGFRIVNNIVYTKPITRTRYIDGGNATDGRLVVVDVTNLPIGMKDGEATVGTKIATISGPTTESQSAAASSRIFTQRGVTTSGGTVSSYNWQLLNATGGTWSFSAGGGTTSSTATPQVTGVAPSNTATATLRCTVTFTDAQTAATSNVSLTFQNTTPTTVTATIGGTDPEVIQAASSSRTFSARTVSTSGATVSSYAWSVINTNGGTWSVAGSTTATATPSVSGVAAQATVTGTLRCIVTFSNGATASDTVSLSFKNTSVASNPITATTSSTTSTGSCTTADAFGSCTANTTFVTANATGGSGSYSYAWEYVSGTTASIVGATSATAQFSRTGSAGQILSGYYRCKVTDTNGAVAYTPNVEVRTTHNSGGGGGPPPV